VLLRALSLAGLVAACASPPTPRPSPPPAVAAPAPAFALPTYHVAGVPRLPPLVTPQHDDTPYIRLPTRDDVRPGETLVTTAMVEAIEQTPAVRFERRAGRGAHCRPVELHAYQTDWTDPGAFVLEVRAYRRPYRTARGALRRRYASDHVSFFEGLTDGPTGSGDGIEQWDPRRRRWSDVDAHGGVSCPTYVPVTVDGEGTIRIGDAWALYESLAACRAPQASRPVVWRSC
jgi:hypothetical protein